MSKLQCHQSSHRFSHHHSKGCDDGKFDVAIEGKEDEENQKDGERTNDPDLFPGGQIFAILAAPGHLVTRRQVNRLSDRFLSVPHGSGQVAALNAVLYADVAGVILAVDESRAVADANIRDLTERNLLPSGICHEEVGDLPFAAAKLRFRPYDQVKLLFPLNHLRDSLSSDRGLDHCLNIADVNAVARALRTVHIHQSTGLAEFAHHYEIGESRYFLQSSLHFQGLFLQDAKVRTINFHSQSAFQSCQGFVHSVFRGLGIVENDARKGLQFGIDGVDEFFLVANAARLPYPVFVGMQTDIELIIKKPCRISTVIRTPQFRGNGRNLWE